MPMLAVTNTSPSISATGRAIASAIRSAMSSTVSSLLTLRQRIVNSSPPKRATTPLDPITELSRSATATSRRSPTVCPRLSFTTLNRSTSRNSTAMRSRRGRGVCELASEAFDELEPVRQSGERVVRSLVGEAPHRWPVVH